MTQEQSVPVWKTSKQAKPKVLEALPRDMGHHAFVHFYKQMGHPLVLHLSVSKRSRKWISLSFGGGQTEAASEGGGGRATFQPQPPRCWMVPLKLLSNCFKRRCLWLKRNKSMVDKKKSVTFTLSIKQSHPVQIKVWREKSIKTSSKKIQQCSIVNT